MKICIVNGDFNLGGAQKVVTELANSLSKKGNDVYLIDFSGQNKYFYAIDKKVKVPTAIEPRTLRRKLIHRIKLYKYKYDHKPIKVVDLFREQIKNLLVFLKNTEIDILILSQGELTAVVPHVKKEIPSLKVVAWQHNDFDIYIKKYYKNIINDYTMSLKKSDLVVCLTSIDVEKFWKYNDNTHYIYNPLTISTNRKSNLDSKNIVFVGRLNIEQKGLDYLIGIAKTIQDGWKILIAGDGEDREKFKQLIEKNGVDHKILLRGPLSSEELIDFYEKGSIFISTSKWEGFGLVITEAMASGLPIVSFDNQGPREILANGRYGLIANRHDVIDFSLKLDSLINSKKLRIEYQEKSLERALDFRIEKITLKWESLLMEILLEGRERIID